MSDPIVTPPVKRCTKCGNEFPATTEFFYRKERGLYGLYSWCKSCHTTMTKVSSSKWNRSHPERTREAGRRYYHNHLEQERERSNLRYWNNPDAARDKVRDWLQTERGKQLHRAKQHRRRARKQQSVGTHTAADIRTQLKRQKGRCYWCGEKVMDYHVDHVIPLSRRGSNGPENLVIACPSCNLSKGRKLPHEWNGGGGRMF